MTEPPFQANDPEQVRKRKQKTKDIRDQQADELRVLLKVPEFRRFIWRHIHETCKLMQSPFSSNGSVQSHDLGMQDVARILWVELERADAEVIPQMMIEYSREQKT